MKTPSSLNSAGVILKEQIPSEIFKILGFNILGFNNALKLGVKETAESRETLRLLVRLFSAKSWNLIDVSNLAEYFYRLKNHAQGQTDPCQKVIRDECDLVLDFLKTHFDILEVGGSLMVSVKIETFIAEIKKDGDV